MGLRTEGATKLLILCIGLPRLLALIVICIGRCVLVEVLSISVFKELIVCCLIECSELATFPLFKLFLRPLVTLVHVPMLSLLLCIPLLFRLSLPLIHIVEILFRKSVSLCFCLDARVSLLEKLKLFLNMARINFHLLRYLEHQDDTL